MTASCQPSSVSHQCIESGFLYFKALGGKTCSISCDTVGKIFESLARQFSCEASQLVICGPSGSTGIIQFDSCKKDECFQNYFNQITGSFARRQACIVVVIRPAPAIKKEIDAPQQQPIPETEVSLVIEETPPPSRNCIIS